MSFEWPEIPIDDLKAPVKGSIAMGPFGSRIKKENFTEEGIPVLKGGNLHGAFVDDTDCDFLTPEKADELSSANAFKGDIVITHRGTIGQVSIIPENAKYERFIVSQSQLKVSLDRKMVNPYFVNYFLRSPLGQHRLLSYSSQVGVPAIAKASTSVRQIKVPCPDIRVQNEIVKVLKDLDDKIAKNNEINQTLEAMAQALFKSWFVDFDPVKAKMEARANGGDDEVVRHAAMTVISGKSAEELVAFHTANPEAYAELAATADLFPESLVESELGLIPEGWEVKPLSATIQLVGGGTPKRSEPLFWDGTIPWFSVKDIPHEGNIFVIDTEEKITELGLSRSSTKLLETGTTIITARGTVGKLAIVGRPMAMNQSCYGIKGISPYFNYFNLQSQVSILRQNTHGAVFDTITQTTFDSAYSAIPIEKSIISHFECKITSSMESIKNNCCENQSLIQLRDTLLPKLLSGEMDLSEFDSNEVDI